MSMVMGTRVILPWFSAVRMRQTKSLLFAAKLSDEDEVEGVAKLGTMVTEPAAILGSTSSPEGWSAGFCDPFTVVERFREPLILVSFDTSVSGQDPSTSV